MSTMRFVLLHLCLESVIMDFYRVPYAIVSMEMHLLLCYVLL